MKGNYYSKNIQFVIIKSIPPQYEIKGVTLDHKDESGVSGYLQSWNGVSVYDKKNP